MMLALVCVLFGFAWLIDRRGLRRFSRVLGLASLLLVFAVGCGPLPSWMLQHLQRTGVNDFNAWGARNVIVLLGAGTVRPEGRDAAAEANLFAYGRIVESARLYWQCRHSGGDCKIEISGGDARGLGLSEAVVYQRVLLGLGIPRADLIMEPSSMNTWQNAQFSQPLLRAYRPDRIALVSSATHLRRAELYFRHFGIDATPVRADWLTATWSILPQSYNFTLADVALHEYLGIARYQVYQWLGWNVKASEPGAL
ncbi:YdcF family protein [Xanthomonas euvesicatoria]|uniref:YdcF family protein n=1 Tax=Xanthomonas TaxID=338 RepID=UPI002454B1E2|nr:YdcF family protein [Xanthomonas euvesicatoria]MDH4907704.1 YdcF family protein [Xanthomonas euvesicatoria]